MQERSAIGALVLPSKSMKPCGKESSFVLGTDNTWVSYTLMTDKPINAIAGACRVSLETKSCRNDQTPLFSEFPLLSVGKLQPWVRTKSQILWLQWWLRRMDLTVREASWHHHTKEKTVRENDSVSIMTTHRKVHQSDSTGPNKTHVFVTCCACLVKCTCCTAYPRGTWIWLERSEKSHNYQFGVWDQDRNSRWP